MLRDYFCANNTIFYFTEPGSVFFTNLIFLHDEICMFLIWILVFTYWMLYSILKDHIYYINVFKNTNTLQSIIVQLTSIIFSKLELLDNKKSFFSGLTSNYLTIEGKLLEIEEFYLIYNSTNNKLMNFNIKKTDINSFKNNQSFLNFKNLSSSDFINAIVLQNENLIQIFDLEKKFLSQDLILGHEVESYLQMIDWNDDYEIQLSDKEVFKFNNILNLNMNFDKNSFYQRRFTKFSYFFNPYIEVFNYLPHHWLGFEIGRGMWSHFKYLYWMSRSRLDYMNLKHLNRGINRDIVIQGWEYNHSLSFEYIWALFPTLVILSIIGPSFILLFTNETYNDASLYIKVIGHQWYWSYQIGSVCEVSPESGINFDSYLLNVFEDMENQENFGKKRLLNVNKHLILLAHKTFCFLVTSGDVLHSFAVPAFGMKIDAVPGRLNSFYLEGARVGMYYGQCSELCGFGHGFMPIVIEMVKERK